MRIRRLDLLRHGHFTDRHLEFERRPIDLHVVFGANEAGKSTARCAISDFLFGFDTRSPHGFRHSYPHLLVGAVLESGERHFEARRRKGNKDTLVRADGVALAGAEARLGQLLGGVDRAVFERMFSLDQQRLREGGNEILREQGHAARTLFAASAGLATLRATSDALDREADALWGPRRAAHRQFTAAQQKLQQAQQLVREHTLGASRWEDLRDAIDAASRKLDGLTQAIAETEATRRRLSRVRRVHNPVTRLASLIAQRAGLGTVASLPEDARARFEQARVAMQSAEVAMRELDADIHSRTERLAALAPDEKVLVEESSILDLQGRRGAILKARADLPGLRRQLAQLHEAIGRRAQLLGWAEADPAALMARAPSRTDIEQAREALEARGKWADLRNAALRELRDAEDAVEQARGQRDALGEAEDTTALEGMLSAARRGGDPDERIASLSRSLREGEGRLEHGLRGLQPPVASIGQWLSLPVPTREEVRAAAELAAALVREVDAEERALASADDNLARVRSELERAALKSHVVSHEAVEDARARRDAGWALIERQYISGPSPDPAASMEYSAGDPSGLAGAYRRAVARADALADQRFDAAEAVGRLAELSSAVKELEAGRQRHADRLSVLRHRGQALHEEWLALWRPSGVVPGAPEGMLGWLQSRAQALDATATLESTLAQLQAEESAREALRAGIIGALRSGGVAADALLAGNALQPVFDAAQARLSEAGRRNAARERLDAELARAVALRKRRVRQLAELDAEGSAWLSRWSPLAAHLGLPGAEDPGAPADPAGATLRTPLSILDELRQDAERAMTLCADRIGKIERDLALFADDVGRLVKPLDPVLAALAPEDAVGRLSERLDAARRVQQQRDALQMDIRSQQTRRATRASERAEDAARIEALMVLAGESTLGGLGEAIARAEQLRRIESDIAQTRADLTRQGDGLPEEELAQECEGVDLDAAAVSEQAAEQHLKDLRAEHTEARDALVEARRQLADALGGTDINAAHAALNAAAAELRGIAESYLRVNTARQLLRWALERYRREQQGPLLRRAGQLFVQLTGDSFEGLEIGYDERDEARMIARRRGDEAVGVEGLSEGTRDQLFLALRIASVEHQLASSAESMPFVADDLFVNFDDERTRAGLRMLAGLAGKTQVLVFTHHAHVVELARAETRGAAAVIEL